MLDHIGKDDDVVGAVWQLRDDLRVLDGTDDHVTAGRAGGFSLPLVDLESVDEGRPSCHQLSGQVPAGAADIEDGRTGRNEPDDLRVGGAESAEPCDLLGVDGHESRILHEMALRGVRLHVMNFAPPRSAVGPAIGIIVVNFNGGAFVLDALASVYRQTLQAHRVVVIDNASDDGSPAAIAAAYPDAELVVLDRNTGFAAANNRGIEMLDDCEYVALLNPDAVADDAWLESIVVAAETHDEFASFASRIERADDPSLLDSAGDVYHVYGTAWPGGRGTPCASATSEREVFGASGAAAFYRRDWLLRVGAFDERYFCYFEDVDLNLRLQVVGGRCLYVPGAHVRHVGGASSVGHSEFAIYYSQRNLVWTYVKSMPPHLIWRYLPLHVLLNLGSIASYGIRGHWRALLRAKRDAILGLPSVLRVRRSVMESADYDRAIFDCNVRRGLRVLLRETRP